MSRPQKSGGWKIVGNFVQSALLIKIDSTNVFLIGLKLTPSFVVFHFPLQLIEFYMLTIFVTVGKTRIEKRIASKLGGNPKKFFFLIFVSAFISQFIYYFIILLRIIILSPIIRKIVTNQIRFSVNCAFLLLLITTLIAIYVMVILFIYLFIYLFSSLLS